MTTTETPPIKPKRIDDVIAEIADIAANAEKDSDRLRALHMLQDRDPTSLHFAEPLNETERLDRLCRVMRGAGRARCQRAWRKLWPTSRLRIDDSPFMKDVVLSIEDEDLIRKVMGLKQLYRFFPEIVPPSGGTPNGFPYRGKEVQKEWCQRQARKILVDRQVAQSVPKEPDPEG